MPSITSTAKASSGQKNQNKQQKKQQKKQKSTKETVTETETETMKQQTQQQGPAVVAQIVAGSYEKLLFGGDFTAEVLPETEELKLEFELSFAYPSHLSAIKSVALSRDGTLLASGGNDENIKIYDLELKKEK